LNEIDYFENLNFMHKQSDHNFIKIKNI